MSKAKNKSLHVLVTEKQHEYIRQKAFDYRMTMGEYIRTLINSMMNMKVAKKKGGDKQ